MGYGSHGNKCLNDLSTTITHFSNGIWVQTQLFNCVHKYKKLPIAFIFTSVLQYCFPNEHPTRDSRCEWGPVFFFSSFSPSVQYLSQMKSFTCCSVCSLNNVMAWSFHYKVFPKLPTTLTNPPLHPKPSFLCWELAFLTWTDSSCAN